MNPRRIRFVFGEERRRVAFKGELITAKHVVFRTHQPLALERDRRFVCHSSGVGPHAQVLRNQSVGSKCNAAFSGPRFAIVRRIRMSFSEAFAYSAKTSK